MLLNLIVHQPQAMLQVISHTPYWVWGMLAGLVGLGASQLRDRSASLLRTQLMPLGMAAFSVAGLLSAFGGSASSGVQAVVDGEISCTVAQDPYNMGYQCVKSLLDVVEGEKLDDFIDTGCSIHVIIFKRCKS